MTEDWSTAQGHVLCVRTNVVCGCFVSAVNTLCDGQRLLRRLARLRSERVHMNAMVYAVDSSVHVCVNVNVLHGQHGIANVAKLVLARRRMGCTAWSRCSESSQEN